MKKITTILVILALIIGILTLNGPVIASPGNLTNAGFETGNLDSWSVGTVVDFAGAVSADSYTAPYQGIYMARLGTPGAGTQPIGNNTIFQNFTVTEPPISFAYNIFTYDATNDHFHYKVTDLATGFMVAYYAQSAWGSGNDLKNTGWRPVNLDLSGYMGKQVNLEFDCGGTGDIRYATWCYIDSSPTPDAIPPITTLSTNPASNANGWNNTDVTINLSSSDNPGGSGVKEIHYSINGGVETIVIGASVSFGLSAEGNNNISFYAKDQLNNTETPNSRFVKIDKTPPGPTSFISTPPALSNSASASFSWTSSSDNLTPVGSLVYQNILDGVAIGNFFSGASTGLNGLNNGSHTFNVRTKDLAGNIMDSTAYIWVVDNISPAITASATANGNPYTSGTWTNKDVVVSFTCSDNTGGSGIDINTVAGGTVITEGAGQSVPNTGACTDKAGNSATPATFSGINIDKTAPGASVASVSLSPNALGWNNSDVTINFTCTDGLSGIGSCPTPQVISTDGRNQTRTVTVVDKAGNSVTVTSGNINIDKIKPTTYIAIEPPANANGWNNTGVTVSLTPTDNLSGVVKKEYNLDGAGWVAYISPLSILSEGTHTLLYRSTDRADNQEIDKTINILIDQTPPTTTATPGPVVDNSVSVILAAADNLSGVAKTEYNLDGTGWIAYTAPVSANGIGAHVLLYRSIDKAGNQESDKTLTISISINRAPTVTNPGNQTSTEGGSVSLQVVANDPDGDRLTYSGTGLPPGLGINATTGLISGTLATGSAGSYSVTVSASDGTLSDSKMFTWQVNGTGGGFQLGRFVAFSTENIWLRSKSKIITGDVGANTSLAEKERKHREDEEDDGKDRDNERDNRAEVIVGEHVQMLESASRVVGDTVWLRNDSSVYNVYYNEMIKHKSADILGGKYKPLNLPVLAMPALPSFNPGTQDIEVKAKETRTLAPGAYRKITVQHGGTLILTGGLYQISTLDIRTETKVLFKAKSDVRVKNEMDTDASTYIGPDPSLANLTAHDIVFYVAGADDKGRRHDDDQDKDNKDEDVSPTVVQIGTKNILLANIYSPNGTVWLKEETKGTGAFIGKKVRIGEKVELKLDSAF